MRALSRRALGSNPSPVALNNFSTQGQAYAGSGIFFPPMEALKKMEYFISILRIKINTVIAVGNTNPVPIIFRIESKLIIFFVVNANLRRHIFSAKFDAVAQQVHKYLTQLSGIAVNGGQAIDKNFCLVRLNGVFKVALGLCDHAVEVDRRKRFLSAGNARKT